MTIPGVAVLGGPRGVKIANVFLKKTTARFGRAELSLRLSCTEFCALSSGHGPRVGGGFQGGPSGVDFYVSFGRYWGGQIWNRIFGKTRVGFGRTELSLRLSCTEFCALLSGHGPRDP